MNTYIQDKIKEFDEKFSASSYFCSCIEGDMYDIFPSAKEELKQFLYTALTEQEERHKGEIEEIIKMIEVNSFDDRVRLPTEDILSILDKYRK